MNGYVENIEKATLENTNFRKVVYTGQHAQVVLMCIEVGDEIGLETHPSTDQFLRVEKGIGKLTLDEKEYEISDGFAIVVPAGAKHNVVNISSDTPLKLYTIYSPPHHKDGTIHKTKEEAEKDTGDHL